MGPQTNQSGRIPPPDPVEGGIGGWFFIFKIIKPYLIFKKSIYFKS